MKLSSALATSRKWLSTHLVTNSRAGMAMLVTSVVCSPSQLILSAADDPPTTAAGTQAASQTEAAKKADESTADEPLTTTSLMKLLQSSKLDEAIQKVDAALSESKKDDVYYWSYLLAGRQAQSDPAAAQARYEQILSAIGDKLQNEKTPLAPQAASAYGFSAQALSMQLTRQGKNEQALKLLEDVAKQSANLPGFPATLSSGIDLQRCRVLVTLNRSDEAVALMDQRVQAALKRADQADSAANLQALVSVISSYSSLFRESAADKLNQYRQTASEILEAALAKESSTPAEFQVYQTHQIAIAMDLSETDIAAAVSMLEQLKEQADKFSEKLDEQNRSRMVLAATSLKSALARLESKRKIAELIGKPAPDWDIAAVVNMDKLQLADLKGKVVLIDFWAVWCGPCIATFPHLKHWHDQYADKGLVIVGATRAYGYTWDTEAQRTVSKKDASLEEELAMLEEFRKFHKLEHGFVVTPQGSDFAKQYGVTGIPQAVLVDQHGNIQMIRIGSGEKNATDLENKIKELLGVSSESTKSTPAS